MSKRGVILYDTEMRTAMEERRVVTLHRKREIRLAAALGLLCFLQVLTLMMMAGTWLMEGRAMSRNLTV